MKMQFVMTQKQVKDSFLNLQKKDMNGIKIIMNVLQVEVLLVQFVNEPKLIMPCG